jgi:asparagine synthase (glutamine-hydrolysing)
MCGIIGQVNIEGPIDKPVFERMLKALVHRGPDGSGMKFFNDSKAALGHTRLSIIDLSDAGSQPMTNEDGSIWLTFNGEIYNYVELRKELQKKNHVFKSSSDSEVIIHAYEEWGIDCVKRFRGIFAFGIYDCCRHFLFIARDHVGVKPLYYTLSQDKFVFASEPRALITDPKYNISINQEAFSLYLAYGNVPSEHCIYSGIKKLLPGHSILLRGGKITVSKYWKLNYNPIIKNGNEASEVIKEKIVDSVISQAISDVPIGTLLSGGIDSTIITSILADNTTVPLPTFTIGFQEQESDERSYAKFVSDNYLTHHHEEVLTYTSACSLLPSIVNAFDEPFHLNGLFPFYCVSQLVKNNKIKVVLGGDGADELFAGYLWYEQFQKILDSTKRTGFFESLKTLMVGDKIKSQYVNTFFKYSGYLKNRPHKDVLGRQMTNYGDTVNINDVLEKHWRTDYPSVLAAQVTDFNCFMVDHCLTKVDRSSMSCGVEVRVPFLDIELVNLIFSIDHKIIFNKNERKSLLKKAMNDHLPAVMDKNRKKGFSSPMDSWLKQGLSNIGKEFLFNGSLCQRGFINPDNLFQLFDSFNYSNQLMLISAELWSRRWIENDFSAIDNFSTSLKTEALVTNSRNQ